MASHFSANQYEDAFKPQRLQNWTLPKKFKERPTAADGHTKFIATDRGHLFPEMKSKRGSKWTFVGTWDLPSRTPLPRINPTARSLEGQERLKRWEEGQTRTKSRTTSVGSGNKTCAKERSECGGDDNQLQENMPPPGSPGEAEQKCVSPNPEAFPASPAAASQLSASSSRQQAEAQSLAEESLTSDVD
ncbi:protein Flattop isoform X1 [Scleropages formosus]|uniref:protein Flattop isoform X1 n=1 Tax=Scleropages formosus TaxID=113540 RepID=UPI0010FA8993|nr:protein Flattop isoform X1 [Scleropages formosus]XP_018580860.2 protein Flattop isoform X1 [Scleropages formosus]